MRFLKTVDSNPNKAPPSPKSDFAVGLLVYAASAFVFYPLTRFLFTATVGQEQLLHAFLVLAMAGALLIYERRVNLRPEWDFGHWSRWLLGGSYALLLAVLVSGWTVLMIPSFSLAVASGAIWAFGERVKRFVGALVGAFALFQGFVLLLPAVDWPLRRIAGEFSSWSLSLFGKETQLGLREFTNEPQLILLSNGQPFHVAAECNGFGVLMSSLLLALLLVLYRRIHPGLKVTALLVAGGSGLIFNTLRITVIVLLAPIVGQDHYLLMHEIVGSIVYYGALIAVWLLIQRLPRRPNPPVASKVT